METQVEKIFLVSFTLAIKDLWRKAADVEFVDSGPNFCLQRFTGRHQPCQKALLTLGEAIHFYFESCHCSFSGHIARPNLCVEVLATYRPNHAHTRKVLRKKKKSWQQHSGAARAEVIYLGELGWKPLRASQMARWQLRRDTASSANAQTPRLKHAVAGLDQFSSRMKASQVSWRVRTWKDR